MTVFVAFGEAVQPSGLVVEKGYPVTALVLAGQADGTLASIGTAVVVRENGVLLTAHHVVMNATALQVRFKN